MSLEVQRAEAARHLVLRASRGEVFPEALVEALRAEGVSYGWFRGTGVLEDIELRAFDATLGTLGRPRSIAGPVQALSVEGSVTLADGEESLSFRAVLARETDRGLETLAGEIASARAVTFEIFVTALDEFVPAPRAVRAAGTPQARAPAWSAALEASADTDAEPAAARVRPAPSAAGSPGGAPAALIPPRRLRPGLNLDAPVPEVGDVVDHFAFGRCDVLKSDGERLHLKVHKDGRIREIALEMLRVTPLELATEEGGRRRFKLERRL